MQVNGVAIWSSARYFSGGNSASCAIDVLYYDSLPRACPIGTAINLATVSVGPPAAKGTTRLIDFVGQSFCEKALPLRSALAVSAAVIPENKKFLIFTLISIFLSWVILPPLEPVE